MSDAVNHERFALRKWYVDASDQAGTCLIGYWSSLSWRGLSLVWQSITTHARDTRPSRRWSLHGSAPPSPRGTGLVWDATPMSASLELRPEVPRIERRLWTDESNGGTVDWRCEAPAASVRATVDDRVYHGVGYAECLDLTIAPWRLPIRELRWGRWCDDAGSRSVVWIEWRGPVLRRWVFLDGRAVEARVGDTSVLGASFELTLPEPVTLERRSVVDALAGAPALLKVLPSSLGEMREHRWFSRGTLASERQPRVAGQAIYETVVFP